MLVGRNEKIANILNNVVGGSFIDMFLGVIWLENIVENIGFPLNFDNLKV